MVIFKKVADLQEYLSAKAANGLTTGFVPTMGALHKGHISLIKQAKEQGYLAVCSIFVNPTQFNDKKDFEKYPISVAADVALLLDAGCNVLFLPEVDEVYPDGEEKMPVYEFGYLDTILEGAKRPGHFKGVGQVVARLLDIVLPEALYLGQKDYQQCMIIKDLVEQRGNNMHVIIAPTIREDDGLAMSSRNRRLTEPQRALAGIIYQCLVSIQTKQGSGRFSIVKKECLDLMNEKGLSPEYVELADADTLEVLTDFDASKKMVALVATRIGDVRLIDNIILN